MAYVTTLTDGLRGTSGPDKRQADSGWSKRTHQSDRGEVFMLKRFMVILAAMAMVASACGSDSDDASGGGDVAATTAAPADSGDSGDSGDAAAAADSSDPIRIPIHN